MQIGIRILGGDPEAFYRLSRERQLDVMAVLQVERTEAEPEPKAAPEVAGSPDALAFWSSVVGG